MPAVRLLRWQSEPELVGVPVPEPGPGEVLLKVDAAGLCHTDLHLMEWPAGTVPYTLPFTLGHETAGTVVAFGPGAALGLGARGVSKGDRVLVYARWGCGACWPCLQGRAGAVRAETECFTLGQAVDAYRRLRRGEVRGRAVITPGTSHPPDVVSV